MLNLLCRANPTLYPPICLCFIWILRFGKRLLGMPIRMAALTLEKNWITKGVRCTMPGVETCSIIILPPGLNDSTLSSSCLKAVSPLSMLHTAWEAVVSRLFLWEKQSRSPHQQLAYWGLQANWFLSLGTANGWNTFPWIDCYWDVEGQWHLNSDLEWQQVKLSIHKPTMGGAEQLLTDISTSTSFRKISGLLKSTIFCRRSKHSTVMLNLLCRANLTLCPPICLCFIGILRFRKRLLGMPIRMAALTLEKNWITKGVRCTMPGVEKRLSAKVSMLGRYCMPLLILRCCLHIENMDGIKAGTSSTPVSLWSKIRIARSSTALPLELNDSTLSHCAHLAWKLFRHRLRYIQLERF